MEIGVPLGLTVRRSTFVGRNSKGGYELYDVSVERGFQLEEILKVKKIYSRNFGQETEIFKNSISWKHKNLIKGEFFCQDNRGYGYFYYENYEMLKGVTDLSPRAIKSISVEYCLALDFIHSKGYRVTGFGNENLVIRRTSKNIEGCFVSVGLAPINPILKKANEEIRTNFRQLAMEVKNCLPSNQDGPTLPILLDFIITFQTSDTLWAFPSLMTASNRIAFYVKVANEFNQLDHKLKSDIENEFRRTIGGKRGQIFEWVGFASTYPCLLDSLTYDHEKNGDKSIKYVDGWREFLRFCRNTAAHISRKDSSYLIDMEDEVDKALTAVYPDFLDLMHYLLYKKYVFVAPKQPPRWFSTFN